jgi:hypothetical protein
MKAFHGSKELKHKYIDRINAHVAAGELSQRTGYQPRGPNGKPIGGFIGCTFDDYDMFDLTAQSEEIGVPEWLLRLLDQIFDGLLVSESKKFAADVWPAVNIGANLEPLKHKFFTYLLEENVENASSLAIPDTLKKQLVNAIRGVLALHERAITSGEWDAEAAASAEAAWTAAHNDAIWSTYAANEAVSPDIRWRKTKIAASALKSPELCTAYSAEWPGWGRVSAPSSTIAYARYAAKLLRLISETV